MFCCWVMCCAPFLSATWLIGKLGTVHDGISLSQFSKKSCLITQFNHHISYCFKQIARVLRKCSSFQGGTIQRLWPIPRVCSDHRHHVGDGRELAGLDKWFAFLHDIRTVSVCHHYNISVGSFAFCNRFLNQYYFWILKRNSLNLQDF